LGIFEIVNQELRNQIVVLIARGEFQEPDELAGVREWYVDRHVCRSDRNHRLEISRQRLEALVTR
jgi:hypothetical protein